MNNLLVLLILGMICLPVQAVHSAQTEKKSEKVIYEEYWSKLEREKPEEYKQNRRMMRVVMQMELARMAFGIDLIDGELNDKTVSAIKKYEKARKLPITGDPLSFETNNQIMKDSKVFDDFQVSLPSSFFGSSQWDNGYFSAKGTWVLLNDSMGNATQTTKIDCFRDAGFCSEATVSVMGGMLYVDTDFYDIERWDSKEIVTKPLDMPLGCVRYARRINRTQEKVRGVRSTISNDAFCKDVDRSDLYMELVDGFDVFYPLSQEKKNKQNSLLNFSVGVRKYFDDLLKENSKKFEKMKN